MTGPIEIIHGHVRPKERFDVITDAKAPMASSMLLTVVREQRQHFNPDLKIRQISYGQPSNEDNWPIRVLPGRASLPLLIGDTDTASVITEEMSSWVWEGSRSPSKLAELVAHFQRLWSLAQKMGKQDLLIYEDLVLPSIVPIERRIAEVSESQWEAVVNIVAAHPDAVLRLSPREFERFVLELLVREGYNATLTPEWKDGGCDVDGDCDLFPLVLKHLPNF